MAFAMPNTGAPTNPAWGSIYYGAPPQQGGEYAWQQKMLGTMGSGNPFNTGGSWGQMNMGVPVGGDPNAGWGEALKGAYNQSQQSYDQALKALGNSFSQGPFGQGLQNIFANPQGISDQAYNGYLRMIRDREAGSRGNALEALQNAGAASGFGNSMGLLDAGARLRAQSASNLNDAELQLLMQREQAKLGQQGMAGGLLAQLMNMDANQAQSLAQLLANRSYQAFAPTPAPWQGVGGGQAWTLPT